MPAEAGHPDLRGKVVLVTGAGSGIGGRWPYAASKAAVLHLTRNLAVEYGEQGSAPTRSAPAGPARR